MATTSKTLIKYKMLSFQRKLHIFKKEDATSNVACTKVTEDQHFCVNFNPLNTELNPICHLLALLGAPHIFHVSRLRVKHICMILGHIAQVLCK